ncbi:helix-turn-helix transcriptional regulator [Pseudogemmobacter humi]|uniref:HTH-type transcriptional regulator MalT n=1 Tax=Pseudogemmobacter humi TaxID=2483812 RepID=A0A3P5XWI4_9RHOB|nr:helix-turn-helix transcriptional regulator [Pseudogemmobacter humi]VDC33487.1 HTH-type transcriptional regulator MalT [Pseudogemmobacter humi]
MSDWNDHLARAIRALGRPGFPQALEAALARLIPFRICMIFSYDGRRRPQSLYHNMAGEVAGIVVGAYSDGPWLLDPFYGEISAGRRSGVFHLRELAPDGFFRTEYYQKHYRRTGIRDEMGIPAVLEGGATAVLSIARTLEAPGFSRTERRLYADVAPVVAALMAAHWGEARPSPDPTEAPQLETVLHRLARDLLTAREVEVIGMILKGYSAAAIAARLEISEGTVKVHRKNSYRKLGISSQAELFSLFIASV